MAQALPRPGRRRQVRRQRHGDEDLKRAFAEDMVYLRYAGLRPVVVHGGGPQISADAQAARHPSRVPRRLPRHDARGDDGRPRGARRRGQPRDRRPDQRTRRRSPSASPARTAGCSPATQKGVVVDGEQVDLGQVGDIVDVDPSARARRSSTPAASRSSRSIAPDVDAARPVAQRERGRRGGGPGGRARRGEARRCSPTSPACTATGPNRDSLVSTSSRRRAPRAAAEPRVGHDPQDDRVPRRRRRRGGEGGDHRRPRSRTRSCSRSSPGSGIGTEVVPADDQSTHRHDLAASGTSHRDR